MLWKELALKRKISCYIALEKTVWVIVLSFDRLVFEWMNLQNKLRITENKFIFVVTTEVCTFFHLTVCISVHHGN